MSQAAGAHRVSAMRGHTEPAPDTTHWSERGSRSRPHFHCARAGLGSPPLSGTTRVLGRCPHATSSPCTSPLHVGEGTSSEGAHTHTPTQRHTSCSGVPESEFGVRLHWSTQVTWPCAPRRRANAAPSKPRRAGNKTTSSEPSSGMLCTAVRAVLRRKQVADARSAANSEMNAASNGIPVELYCVWQMRLCDHPYMWRVYQKKQ